MGVAQGELDDGAAHFPSKPQAEAAGVTAAPPRSFGATDLGGAGLAHKSQVYVKRPDSRPQKRP